MEFINEINVSYTPRLINQKEGITASENAYQQALQFFKTTTINMQEQFVVLYLNRSNKLIGGYMHSQGGITSTIADIRIILATALKSLATGIILCHNHPSGRLVPSEMDKQLTKKVKQACSYMDIQLIDHLVVSENGYYSFADEGDL